MNKLQTRLLPVLAAIGTTVMASAANAQASVPAAIQTAISDGSGLGQAIATSLAVGVAVVTLLLKFYGKVGFR